MLRLFGSQAHSVPDSLQIRIVSENRRRLFRMTRKLKDLLILLVFLKFIVFISGGKSPPASSSEDSDPTGSSPPGVATLGHPNSVSLHAQKYDKYSSYYPSSSASYYSPYGYPSNFPYGYHSTPYVPGKTLCDWLNLDSSAIWMSTGKIPGLLKLVGSSWSPMLGDGHVAWVINATYTHTRTVNIRLE